MHVTTYTCKSIHTLSMGHILIEILISNIQTAVSNYLKICIPNMFHAGHDLSERPIHSVIFFLGQKFRKIPHARIFPGLHVYICSYNVGSVIKTNHFVLKLLLVEI